MISSQTLSHRPALAGSLSQSDPRLIERCQLLRASTLFKGLDEAQCVSIACAAKQRSFMRNELLFMQGHSVQYVMLIQTGSVKLTQSGPSGDEVILWMSGKREAIGIQTQSSPCHSCSARAMSKCNVLIWDISRMQAILSENPQVPYNINYILSSRIEQLEERFREIATERVATRLALTLLRLGKEVGTPHRAGTQISLSREELAQIIGTTLFTISRTLSKWSDSGLIIAEREAVIVPDARRLELASENIEATRAGQVRDTMGKSTRSLLRSSEL